MGHHFRHASASTLRDHLRVLLHHAGLIAFVALVSAGVAVLLSLRQEPLYEGSAEVLLSRQSLAASLTGTPDPFLGQDAQRMAQTQADLARVPAVAEGTLAATREQMTVEEFLSRSSVEPAANADILVFRVTAGNRELAGELTSEYARQFTAFRLELDTAALEGARAEVEERIASLEASGAAGSELYASLVEKESELRTMEALQTSNAFVVREATRAEQVQPEPVRNGILAFVLGLALGIALSYLRETLDTRLRSAAEIGHVLGLPLLGRLPRPTGAGRGAAGALVMLYKPSGTPAEAVRMLRTNLEFVSLDRDVRTLLVTSAVEGEGKSTTAANLAIANARAGRRVVLVDLDLRRPALARFFDLERRPGVTDVALGRAALREALAPIAIPAAGSSPPPGNGNGHARVTGTLGVLPAGTPPPDAGEFVASHALAAILDELRHHADLVVLDTPPILAVGDPLALSARADGIVVVARLRLLRRPVLHELGRVLAGAPTAVLGYVITNAEHDEGYGAAYAYDYGHGARRAAHDGTAPEPEHVG